MTKRWLVLVAVVCIGALALPLLATAQHAVVEDGNDTRGTLDVRRVKLDFTSRPRWTIGTWGPWTVGQVWDRGYFLVHLDTFGSPRMDYYAFIRSDGYAMRGSLVRDRESRPDYTVSSVKASKGSRSTLRVRFPLSKMRIGRQRLSYRWNVQTILSGSRCATSCFDFAPDRGAVEEPIPGRVSPTPTPTITVTPTPTVTITPTPAPTDSP